jgi:cyclopropane fatty-acyl-phospholipid synthase-like methyltransferase
MSQLPEVEHQALLAVWLLQRDGKPATAANLGTVRSYFDRYLLDWAPVWPVLIARGWLSEADGAYVLSEAGTAEALDQRRRTPDMYYWYSHFYEATAASPAYAEFCRRAYGASFAQHGFADLAQLDCLLENLHLRPGDRVLDLGCGDGSMAEHISDVTGAHLTGVDFIAEAIRQARSRSCAKRDRLDFQVGYMDRLDFAPASFDAVISVDTIYFCPYEATLRGLVDVLKPGGQLGVFYWEGIGPEDDATPDAQARAQARLTPDGTDLARALANLGLSYTATDLTASGYAQAARMKAAMEDLRPQFEAEGNLFLCEQRLAEANGIAGEQARAASRRYLYHVRVGA